jgi:hypothetical protein
MGKMPFVIIRARFGNVESLFPVYTTAYKPKLNGGVRKQTQKNHRKNEDYDNTINQNTAPVLRSRAFCLDFMIKIHWPKLVLRFLIAPEAVTE